MPVRYIGVINLRRSEYRELKFHSELLVKAFKKYSLVKCNMQSIIIPYNWSEIALCSNFNVRNPKVMFMTSLNKSY